MVMPFRSIQGSIHVTVPTAACIAKQGTDDMSGAARFNSRCPLAMKYSDTANGPVSPRAGGVMSSEAT